MKREKKRRDLFAGDVVGCELDLAHAAGAEGLCEGVVAEDLVGPCARLRTTVMTGERRHRLPSFCGGHGRELWELFSIYGHLFTLPPYPVLPQHSPSRQHYLRQSAFVLLVCCTPTTASTPVAAPTIPNVTDSDCTQNPTTNDTTYGSSATASTLRAHLPSPLSAPSATRAPPIAVQ